jgi:membrane protease YdiL (CAAX protease family)
MVGPSEGRTIWRDVWRVYLGVLVAVILLTLVAEFVRTAADLLYAGVALLFLLVPQRLIEKREESFERYGLIFGNWRNGVGWGLLFSVGTLPFFLGGFYVWQVHVLEREFSYDAEHYRQWPLELEGKPQGWGRSTGVWVWSEADILHVGIRNVRDRNHRVRIVSDDSQEPQIRGTLKLERVSGVAGGSTEWIAETLQSTSRGEVRIIGPGRVQIRVEPVTEGVKPWGLFLGPYGRLEESGETDSERSHTWIWLWIATQLLLIALPEEYFYRGFLQTRIGEALGSKEERHFMGVTGSIVITSVLFGLGHLLVPVGGVLLINRMAVFFPSLAFGWLRRRTGTIVAPIVYHAACNMMVLLSVVHFG